MTNNTLDVNNGEDGMRVTASTESLLMLTDNIVQGFTNNDFDFPSETSDIVVRDNIST